MIATKHHITFLAAMLFASTFASAQRGPGGVSTETGAQSTCRIWLDAATLSSLADGDPLTGWPDISSSAINDQAQVPATQLPPYFRDDAANSINGYPVVTFDQGRYLELASSADLNLAGVSTSKTVALVFRTSTDVTTTQVLYEEGGCTRGFNIYIDGGLVYVGGYDLNEDGINNPGTGPVGGLGRDGDLTPQWGYSFVSTPIQANTTYVLTGQFSAPLAPTLSTNPADPSFFFRGWLNGSPFVNSLDFTTGDHTNNLGGNASTPNGIGALFNHTDPIGLGAVNADFFNKNGRFCNITGQGPFLGRMAELCYYNDLLNNGQRIILENYLGAKYFASLIFNNKFIHKPAYGNEVMGIGQATNSPSQRHSISKARNPFQIEALSSSGYTNQQYLMIGHNGFPMTYTTEGVPNNVNSIQRLQRIWRVDESGPDLGVINIKVDLSDLPPAPVGFTKLVLIVDAVSPTFPNFSQSNTQVREIAFSSGFHQINFNLTDNSFFTFGWVKPTVSFALTEDYKIEINPLPDSTLYTITAELNYTPATASGPSVMDYFFVPQSATRTTDFGYVNATQQAGLTIPAGSKSATLPAWIKNDIISEVPATENFLVILKPGLNTTFGLNAGERDTLVYSIFDNDAPPVANFAVNNSSANESSSGIFITVLRTGTTSVVSTVLVRRKAAPLEGTATYNADYNMTTSGWSGSDATRSIIVTFGVGESSKPVFINFLDDLTDEFDETVELILEPQTNIAAGTVIEHTLTIVDNDPLPVANFTNPAQEGFESVGSPVIYVELDRPSAKDVEITYQILPSSTATASDYDAAPTATLAFAPSDTLNYPTIIVYNTDGSPEPDETIDIQLLPGTNASIGLNDEHTYTIIDYAPFEWLGAAGVGQSVDNIVWVDMNRVNGGHNTPIPILTNFSPRNITINQNMVANQGRLQVSPPSINTINGRKTLAFDGGDFYTVDNSAFINTMGYASRKSFYFVIRTGNAVSPGAANPQVIFEQGAGSRGMSIYISDSRIYFNAWNLSNDGPESPWGGSAPNDYSNVALRRFAFSNIIFPNTNYIVSCHYDKDVIEKMVVYVNGVKGTPEIDPVGRLYGHTNLTGLGGISNQTRFHASEFSPPSGFGFTGFLAEFILFHEPQENDARRTIISNYLSAKYNIELDNVQTKQVFGITNANASVAGSYFGHEVAGIGSGSSIDPDFVHLDAKGMSELRIKSPLNLTPNSFMVWGHNNIPLTNAYPYSSALLPAGIYTRSGRIWKVFKSGTIDNNTVLFDFQDVQNSSAFLPSDLKLLVHQNSNPQDFSNAAVISSSTIQSGQVVKFDNVFLANNSYISLGSASTMLPLPVELLSFTAKLLGDIVSVNWSTATETNNDYFEVHRCGPDLQWEKIAVVPGAGNSNSTLHYTHYDREPLQGISYYRLKQVDFDGQYTYSDAVAVVNINSEVSDDLFIYPNPSRGGSVFVRVPAAFRTESASIKIYSAIGQVVYSGNYDTNTDLVEVKYGKLQPGVYYIAVESALINTGAKLVIY